MPSYFETSKKSCDWSSAFPCASTVGRPALSTVAFAAMGAGQKSTPGAHASEGVSR
jgi:hypothetical protein